MSTVRGSNLIRWRPGVLMLAWRVGGVLHSAPFRTRDEAMDFAERHSIRKWLWL